MRIVARECLYALFVYTGYTRWTIAYIDAGIAIVRAAKAPQVWIDKQTLRPIRWIVQGAEAGEDTARFEIRYYEWRKIGRIWYPDQIEFVRNGTPVRLIQVEDIIMDPLLAQEMFSIESLLARSQPAQATPDSDSREGGPSDIQKTIEEFKRLFE